jgi:hypothetical protein
VSIRTILEVNHDCIQRMHDEGHIGHELYRMILGAYTSSRDEHFVDGIRILGSRHHSETLELEVK